MKKVLLIATIEDFFNFEKNDIRILKELGYQVHIATNSEVVERPIEIEGVIKHQICFARSPYDKKNIKAYKALCELISKHRFELIHCHTPVGGVMGRLLGHKYHIKTVYTAHGFHFFKGAPKKNWIIFYPIEKFLAKWTDTLITINKEDYALAKSFGASNIEYIPGIGIECDKYRDDLSEEQKVNFRQQCRLEKSDVVLLSVGELSQRKNHQVVLKAIAQMKSPKIKYVICGIGDKEKELRTLAAELGISEQLKLMGYQKSIKNFFKIADIFVFPSLQEGLPVALMEAMASGLPIVASKIRGNVDLIENNKNGFLVPPEESEKYSEKIDLLIKKEEIRKKMNCNNLMTIQEFDYRKIEEKMRDIYYRLLEEN